MQSVCRLSRRWHQQFCRSPSFLSHQKCLQQWQPIRQYRARPQNPSRAHEVAKPRKVGDFVVREYDQDGSDANTRRPTEDNEFESETEDWKEEMEDLDEDLDAMREGPFGPNSEFMQSLEKDERERLLKILDAESGRTRTVIDQILADNEDIEDVGGGAGAEEDYEDEEMVDGEVAQGPVAVTLRVPQQHKKFVKEFNDALVLARHEINRFPHHLDLWRWYLRCQRDIPGFSHFVNEDVWDFLWKSQTVYFPRPAQTVMLGKDMKKAGVTLDLPQTLDYIDALHASEDSATAIQEWEAMKAEVGPRDKQAGRFWETGVKIYAAVGRPKKAQDIASTAYRNKVLGLEAWVPVIQAWASSKKASAGSSLWACYLRLKQQHAERVAKDGSKAAQQIPTEVLGQISSALLNSGRRDMAVSVFKDMLTSSSSSTSQFDSAQIYARTLNQLQSIDDKTEVSESIINRIGLAALTTFPGRFKNKYFFGAWIKWLIGENKVDEAALVVELMQEYGIRPDAKHLNGIIGAWLREGSKDARERAEAMAWGMIHARIAQVKARGDTRTFPSGTAVEDEENPYSDARLLPRFLQRNIPPATIETFSCLLQRYTRQSDVATAEHLTDIMTGPANIPPNVFILNHWMYLSLRQSDLSSLWTRYTKVRNEIEPDLETFAVMWDGCKRNVDRIANLRTPSYPTPRQLAQDMQSWFSGLNDKKKQEAKEAMGAELYEQILRCFCLHSDIAGTFVILRTLRDDFAFHPHHDVLRMVLMAVARMYPDHSPRASRPRQAARKRADRMYHAALGEFGSVMQAIHDKKAAAAIYEGGTRKQQKKLREEIEDDESAVAGKIRFETIEIFLAMVLKRRTHVASGDLVNELIVAGRALGVELMKGDVVAVVEEAEEIERAQAEDEEDDEEEGEGGRGLF